MELRDAMARIARRRVLIAGLVLVGCAVALYASVTAPRTYTSSARVLLAVPVSTEQGTILADATRAIVTSPSLVEAAMKAAPGPDDDVPDIDVQPLGGSGVVQLRVTQGDPEIAAAVVRYLTDELTTEGLRPGTDDISEEQPTLIEPARPAVAPDPMPLAPNLLLGALSGLALGLTLAAVLEALSPNLVSVREVARVVGGPPLGTLSAPFDELRPVDVEPVAIRLQLAARYAGVTGIEVVSDSSPTDLEPLIDLLQDTVDVWDDDQRVGDDGRPLHRLVVAEVGDAALDTAERLPQRATATRTVDGSPDGHDDPRAPDRPADVTTNGQHPVAPATGLVLVVRVPTTRDGPDLAREVLDRIDKLVLGVIAYS